MAVPLVNQIKLFGPNGETFRFNFAYRRSVASVRVIVRVPIDAATVGGAAGARERFGWTAAPGGVSQAAAGEFGGSRRVSDPDPGCSSVEFSMIHAPLLTGVMTSGGCSDDGATLGGDEWGHSRRSETVLVAFEDAERARFVADKASKRARFVADKASERARFVAGIESERAIFVEDPGIASERAEASDIEKEYARDSGRSLYDTAYDVSTVEMHADEAKMLGVMMNLPMLLMLTGGEEATFYRTTESDIARLMKSV